MATVRVVLRWNNGFVGDQLSESDAERSRQALMDMMEKWKADPGIKYICYYLVPQTYHCAVFEADDLSKIDEMNEDINAARGGWRVAECSMEIVLGNPGWDEWWAS
jgi:hypothetical protein